MFADKSTNYFSPFHHFNDNEFNTVQWFPAYSFATRQLTVNLSLLFSTAPNLVRFHFVTPETMEIGDFHRERRAERRGGKAR